MMRSNEPMSPVLEGVIFDWYDGPVSGIAHVAPDGPAYAFQMVAWPTGPGARVYVLRPVGNDVLERAARLQEDAPLRQSEAELERGWEVMRTMLRGAGEIAHVVVSDDLLGGGLSGREIPPGELRARLAAMCLDEPGETDATAFSDHSMADWLAAVEPLRPYTLADLR